MGWIGVDFDGTLVHDRGKDSIDKFGDPIWPMVEKVKALLEAGREVRIFTARVAGGEWPPLEAAMHIRNWCRRYLGRELEITCKKDQHMDELWDDRAVRVVRNAGHFALPEEATSAGA